MDERVLNRIRAVYGMTSSPFAKEAKIATTMYKKMLKENGLKFSDLGIGEIHKQNIPQPKPTTPAPKAPTPAPKPSRKPTVWNYEGSALKETMDEILAEDSFRKQQRKADRKMASRVFWGALRDHYAERW